MCVYLVCLYTFIMDPFRVVSWSLFQISLVSTWKPILSTLDMDGIAGTEAATTKRPGGQEGVIEIQRKTLLHAKTWFKISRCRTLESSILHVVHLLSCAIYEKVFWKIICITRRRKHFRTRETQLSIVFFWMTNLMYSRELLIQLRRLLTWYFAVRVGVRRHARRQCRFFSRRQVA